MTTWHAFFRFLFRHISQDLSIGFSEVWQWEYFHEQGQHCGTWRLDFLEESIWYRLSKRSSYPDTVKALIFSPIFLIRSFSYILAFFGTQPSAETLDCLINWTHRRLSFLWNPHYRHWEGEGQGDEQEARQAEPMCSGTRESCGEP